MGIKFNPFTGKFDYTGDSQTIDLSPLALLAGRSGGQTLIGGTASGDDLTLRSTSNATKGHIFFGTSGYDEVNNRLGIGNTAPGTALNIGEAFTGAGANTYGLSIRYPGGSVGPIGAYFINSGASSSGSGAGFLMMSDDGAALASGDRLGFMLWGGSSSSSSLRNTAGFVPFTSQAWVDGSAYGTEIRVETTPNTTTSRSAGITFTSEGGLIVNEQGRDADTRFEGDTDANTFYLDASTNRIGIGIAIPTEKLDVVGNIKASGTIIGSNVSGTNTGDQDLTGYALLAGRAGGQTLIGGTASGNDLTLQSTSNATKGTIFFGASSAFDEVNNRLGIGVTTPAAMLDLENANGGASAIATSYRENTAGGSFTLRHARGTLASPAALTTNDQIGQYLFQGWDGSDWNMSAGLRAHMDGTDSTRFEMIVRNAGVNIDPAVTLKSSGYFGIGVTSPGGQLDVHQSSTTAAVPTLALTQEDLSEEFIEFDGTVSAGNPINTTALGAYYGRVRVSVNGTEKWMPLYD